MNKDEETSDKLSRGDLFVEKKARVKRLNHQDDVKRSWRAAYPLIEDFEGILPEELERTPSNLDAGENNLCEIQPPVKRQNSDISAE
ncbi:MAG: hypothetical protein LH679_03690 [Cyanobacteria bacterium CAN_BIN43]|nr:hypothetical protein [Cyanobacteria bacterium CAN_BIN43]